jgi:CRISPR/Cas system CSM-associated protein Csm3 (group 7 of RAMP superfamily)
MIESLFARRIEITGELAIVTALHVGSGDHEPDEAIPLNEADKRSGRNENTGSSRVQIDARGLPYIPGSSIKGALRALAESGGGKGAAALFGDPKDEGAGTMGGLIVYGAMLKSVPKDSAKPLYKEKNKDRKTGLALAARTAIDPGRGTADRHKLFHAEELVPGAILRFRMTYLPPRNPDDDKQARIVLGGLLATLEDEAGLALGRGTADGAGRVRLTGRQTVIRRLDPLKGCLVEDTAVPGFLPEEAIRPPGERFNIDLVCQGPFFVNDWSYERPKNSKTDPHLMALYETGSDLQEGAGLGKAASVPALPGASLMGALRARARWIAAIDSGGANDDQIGDDPRVIFLFGSTNRRARLTLEQIECVESGRPGTPTSVKIDRFSGAPIEGALFSVKCVYDPQFKATLRLDPPRERDGPHYEAAHQLLEKLGGNLTEHGLKLGHGSNRGFGWFDVKWEAMR